MRCFQEQEKFTPITIKLENLIDLNTLYSAILDYIDLQDEDDVHEDILKLRDQLEELYQYWIARK
jgi:hypothetical protein